MNSPSHDPSTRGSAMRRPIRRSHRAAPLGEAAPPAAPKPLQSIGRHSARCYDPITGRKIKRAA